MCPATHTRQLMTLPQPMTLPQRMQALLQTTQKLSRMGEEMAIMLMNQLWTKEMPVAILSKQLLNMRSYRRRCASHCQGLIASALMAWPA